MASTSLSITALRQAYASGSLSPTRLVKNIYANLQSHPQQPIWIYQIPEDEAMERACSLESSPDKGALYGIPFAVKDNIDVGGLPTTAGCPAYRYTARQTAFVVQRLLDAGAILIGKTNMDQFATGLVGTRSPFGACASVFDPRYISGGSSSGSAVAVAAGFVSFALGTDTAGSGRVPAAFNNIVGLKPTRGLLSTSHVVPACRSLDCVSLFALNCTDAQVVFRAAAHIDDHDIFSRHAPRQAMPSPRFRVGVPQLSQQNFFGDDEYRRLYGAAIARLKESGEEIIEFDLQPFLDAAQLLYGGPYVAERFAAVGEFVQQHQQDVDPTVGSIVIKSKNYSASEAYAASYKLAELRDATQHVWKKIDALLLPTTPTTYTIESVLKDPIQLNANLGYYTNFVNLLDLSALAVPAGFTQSGLPFGITFVAPPFHEEWLLHAAAPFATQSVKFFGARTLPPTPPAQLLDFDTKGWVPLAVLGAHLRGQPLNHQLTSRGAKFSHEVTTAGDYKLYALTATTPIKPGLISVPGFQGPGIKAEIWVIPDDQFGSFVNAIPPPLGIGTCRLQDGSSVKGFLCENYAAEGMPDITNFGGWLAYLDSKK